MPRPRSTVDHDIRRIDLTFVNRSLDQGPGFVELIGLDEKVYSVTPKLERPDSPIVKQGEHFRKLSLARGRGSSHTRRDADIVSLRAGSFRGGRIRGQGTAWNHRAWLL